MEWKINVTGVGRKGERNRVEDYRNVMSTARLYKV